MGQPLDTLRRWEDSNLPTFDQLGGEAAIFAERDEILACDAAKIVGVLCASWAQIGSKTDAIEFLMQAVKTDDVYDADDVLDVILTSELALPDLAEPLTNFLREASCREGILGDIASQGWTRLALGEWCSGLELRGHLAHRAKSASVGRGETTIYFVRSVGAALHRWNDDELAATMRALGLLDGYEADAAFELGMHYVGRALSAETHVRAIEQLRTAVEHLSKAEYLDNRKDAKAFLAAIGPLLGYAEGKPVSQDVVVEVRGTINDYLIGYRGLGRHWRQGRADTSDGWAELVALLADASTSSDPEWFDPSAVIEAAAKVYTAHVTVELVVSENAAPDRAKGRGLAALVRPAIISAFVTKPPSLQFIGHWLDAAKARGNGDAQLIAAVELLQADVSTRGNSHPKADGGDGPSSVSAVPAPLVEGLDQFLELYSSVNAPLPLAWDNVVRRIIDEIEEIRPEEAAAVRSELAALVVHLVRFVAHHINLRQSGERKKPWLGVSADFPKEHALSEALHEWLAASGVDATIERVNTAGGDVDLEVRFRFGSFYIEVKRVLHKTTDVVLTDRFGKQATQYAATDIPIVFLAVLDYAPRQVRVDLPGVFWTIPFRPEPASREYALTSLRVQANVESPSASSRSRRTSV
ncbi:hypothetical protein [Rhodoglobus sp.]